MHPVRRAFCILGNFDKFPSIQKTPLSEKIRTNQSWYHLVLPTAHTADLTELNALSPCTVTRAHVAVYSHIHPFRKKRFISYSICFQCAAPGCIRKCRYHAPLISRLLSVFSNFHLQEDHLLLVPFYACFISAEILSYYVWFVKSVFTLFYLLLVPPAFLPTPFQSHMLPHPPY